MPRHPFRPTRWHVAAALGLVLIVASFTAFSSNNRTQAGSSQANADPVCAAPVSPGLHGTGTRAQVPDLPPGQSLGIPSIHPRPELASSQGAHFTEADVRQYLATHPVDFAVPGTPAPTIMCVRFLRAAAVNTLLRTDTGVPEATLLCVVRLSGTFQNTYLPAGIHSTPVRRETMVFDAQTGNLLMDSVG